MDENEQETEDNNQRKKRSRMNDLREEGRKKRRSVSKFYGVFKKGTYFQTPSASVVISVLSFSSLTKTHCNNIERHTWKKEATYLFLKEKGDLDLDNKTWRKKSRKRMCTEERDMLFLLVI